MKQLTFYKIQKKLNVTCHTLHVKCRIRGFTLIEVLLSLALIGIIFGMAAPYYRTFQVRNDLDIATNTIVQSLRRAQILSQAQYGDMNWGVYVQSGSIIIFKGPSYVLRDINYDEVFDLPSSIDSSGITEVVFSKLYGFPQSIGTLILTSTSNETRNIIINEKGMVDYR